MGSVPKPREATEERTQGRNENMRSGGKPGDEWPKEIGGQKGPEPTRYGDWEKNGRCTDF